MPELTERERIVSVLKKYPGITANMDLSVNSALVVELANELTKERQQVLAEIEAKAPKDKDVNLTDVKPELLDRWTEQDERDIRQERFGGNNANARWRTVLEEVAGDA